MRRDVTRDDVIEEEERGCDDVEEAADWRLSGLWIDEFDPASQLDSFVSTRPSVVAAVVGGEGGDDAAAADANDDADDGDCIGRRRPRRRCRPDLVPCQSPAACQVQELNKTCSDVSVLHRLELPVH